MRIFTAPDSKTCPRNYEEIPTSLLYTTGKFFVKGVRLVHDTILQHRLGEPLHRLPHAQIRQDLLRAAQDRIELDCAVEHLDHPAHARLRQPAAAEDVGRFGCDLVRRAGRVRLEQRDGPAEVLRLLRVAHVAHLVGDGLEPGLVGLAEGDHPGQPAVELLVTLLQKHSR